MKTNLRIQKLALAMTLLHLPLISFSATKTGAEDPYQQSFEAYAAELKKLSPNSTNAHGVAEYAKDVKTTTKKAGYIGALLPLPKPVKITEGVYMIVGSQIWGNRSNFGHNNNITFAIFDKGVFVYNAGANPAIAYTVHHFIQQKTDKPVKWVAVENDQGHAYMGASYWVDVGVKNLYSQVDANKRWHKKFEGNKKWYMERNGETLTFMARDVTDQFTTFKDKLTLDVGGEETVELINFGGGHTPTMTGAIIPSRKVLFTGDLGFNERLPGLLEDSITIEWLNSFDRMVKMVPKDAFVAPGHGTPTDIPTITRQTYDYIQWLYKEVKAIVDAGGGLEEVDKIDQSAHKDRPVFEQLAKGNARHIYYELKNQKRPATNIR